MAARVSRPRDECVVNGFSITIEKEELESDFSSLSFCLVLDEPALLFSWCWLGMSPAKCQPKSTVRSLSYRKRWSACRAACTPERKCLAPTSPARSPEDSAPISCKSASCSPTLARNSTSPELRAVSATKTALTQLSAISIRRGSALSSSSSSSSS